MDGASFVLLLLILAPLLAGHSHPLMFLAVLAFAATVSFGVGRMTSGPTKKARIAVTFLAALWIGSLLVIFTLKLPWLD